MSSDATMDVARAAEYSEIENSILDAPIVGNWNDPGSMAEGGEESDPFEPVEPGGGELLADLETDRSYQQGEQAHEQQVAPEAQAPQTPESVLEGIQQLDATIEQYQLNDADSANEFAADWCNAFGADLRTSGLDVQAFGSVMAKTAFSALNCYQASQGDPSRLQPVPQEAAQAFTRDFLRSWGVDAREAHVDAQGLANTVLGGVLGFIDTYNRFGGRITDVTQLNSPEAAEHFLGNFLRSLGVDTQVDRGMALKVADACGKYLLQFMGKVQQLQQPRASRSRRAQAAPKFRSNNDLFDPETMEDYQREQSVGRRSASSDEFTPKPRAQKSQFTTNTDIFSDDVLEAMYKRL